MSSYQQYIELQHSDGKHIKTITIDAEASDTALDLKLRIEDKEGIPSERLEIKVFGRIMDMQPFKKGTPASLALLGVQQGSTLHARILSHAC